MDPNPQTRIFSDVFSLDEINLLRRDQKNRAITASRGNNHDRPLDYHLPTSIVRKIVKPKIDSLIGEDHEFSTGCYKEVWDPYGTHADNLAFQSKYFTFNSEPNHYCGIMIPLVQDPEFRTVFFKTHTHDDLGVGKPLPEEYLSSQNDLNPSWFSHVEQPARDQMKRLPLEQVYQWKLGDMIVWPRTQLHTSTDFSKFGLCKRFIIVFLA